MVDVLEVDIESSHMNSIKKNFIFSSILTISNYVFPFLVFPYVSRVLGVKNIGVCNFIDSVINYYILFSMMGIGILGIREIAAVGDNRIDLNKRFSSLLIMNIISTFFALIILIISIYTIPKFYEFKELLFIGAIKLIFNCFLIEWLYKGLEEFKFITIRTVIVKFLYVISVFIFVKSKNDLLAYFSLTALMIIINAVINLLYSRKYASFSISEINLRIYFKSFISLGFYTVLTSMYTSFNVVYLGFVCGEVEVGYYTTAVKLYAIFLSLYTAFTGVMLPRMSALIQEQKEEEFKELIRKSIDILVLFSIPLIIVSIVFAPQIILIIAGSGYEGAVLPMRIVMALLLIIGYEQILVIQILMPLKKDKEIFRNSMIGASLGVLLNILLVGSLKGTGSALVWIVSELIILILSQYIVFINIKISFPYRKLLYNLVCAIPAFGITIVIYRYVNISAFGVLFLGSIFVVLYFFVVQVFILKNILVLNFLNVVC